MMKYLLKGFFVMTSFSAVFSTFGIMGVLFALYFESKDIYFFATCAGCIGTPFFVMPYRRLGIRALVYFWPVPIITYLGVLLSPTTPNFSLFGIYGGCLGLVLFIVTCKNIQFQAVLHHLIIISLMTFFGLAISSVVLIFLAAPEYKSIVLTFICAGGIMGGILGFRIAKEFNSKFMKPLPTFEI